MDTKNARIKFAIRKTSKRERAIDYVISVNNAYDGLDEKKILNRLKILFLKKKWSICIRSIGKLVAGQGIVLDPFRLDDRT